MFDLALHTPKSSLRPARALLTPTWIGALALLVANDHWLKGADMIPGVLTGKLSDFAGMLVAPALFAALIGVRSQRGLLACHVAVGAVFAGIQISPAFAGMWSALMGLFGPPWTITCDLTDLIALPFLLLSWKLLVPEMDASLPAFAPMQRTAVAGLSVFGLWSTVATSQESWADVDGDQWFEDVSGNAFINNANEFEIALWIRPLRTDLSIDCEQVSADPGRLLDPSAFGDAEHWSLPARTNVAISFDARYGCGAVWVGGEGVPETIVFTPSVEQLPTQWFPGQSFDALSLGNAGMAIEFPAEGGTQWIGGENLRFVPRSDAPEQPSVCEPAEAEARFAWQANVPNRAARLLSVEPGVDGCYALELQELIQTYGPNGESGEPVEYGEPYGFYLCVPAAAMPFVPEQVVRFTEVWAAGSSGAVELSMLLLDPSTLDAQLDDNGRVLAQARYLRGGSDPQWIGPAIGRQLVAVDSVSCPWLREGDGCATVERSTALAVVGGQEYLQPGVAVSFADETQGLVHTAVLGYARQLAVVDQACAEGSLQLRYDIDIAVIDAPL